MLTLKQQSEVNERSQKFKEKKKLRKIYPMMIFGEDGAEKEVYVACIWNDMKRINAGNWKMNNRVPHR